MLADADRRRRRLLIVITASAVPLAMGLETVMSRLVFPPEFAEVRLFLHDTLTSAAWLLVALTLLAAGAGGWMQSRLVARARRRHDDDGALERTLLGAFLIAACVPQTPAILATFGFMFGAELAPVAMSVAISTVSVALMGRLLPHGRGAAVDQNETDHSDSPIGGA